ncbi:MAG: hypothetical protein ACI4K7_03665 [Oscillospiraceae bacterium]
MLIENITADSDSNLAMGIKTALARALSEMLEYIGNVPDDEEYGDADEENPTA